MLFSANVFAQLAALLVYPVLTRLFSEADFGLLNLFLSIGGVIAICSTAEWQNSLPIPKDDEKAAAVAHAALVMLFAVTALCIVATTCCSQHIAALFNTSELADYLSLLPIYVFSLGLWQLLGSWLLRKKRFKLISAYQVSQSVLSVALKCGLGVAAVAGGLLYGSVIAPLLTVLIIGAVAWTTDKAPAIIISRQERLAAAREYKKFPLYAQPRALVNTLSSNLPILLLTPAFGLSDAGLFGMAMTLAVRPLSMLTNSVYQVLFQRTAAKISEKKEIRKDIRNFVLVSLAVIVPVFSGLFLILPWLTSWLLGDDWRETGVLIRIMLPWLVMVFVGGSLAFMPDVFAKQNVSLWIECTYVLLRLAALGIGIYAESFRLAIMLFSLVGTLIIAAQLLWYIFLIRKYERERTLRTQD